MSHRTLRHVLDQLIDRRVIVNRSRTDFKKIKLKRSWRWTHWLGLLLIKFGEA